MCLISLAVETAYSVFYNPKLERYVEASCDPHRAEGVGECETSLDWESRLDEDCECE